MQENRSFDHYFGTMPGVRGFSDPEALRLSTGKSVFYQPDAVNPDGYTLPFHLDTKTTSAQAIPSTGHAWAVQHQAWNHGAMDQWLPAHRAADGVNGAYVMGYYKREDIPFQFALADAFTVCDNSFSSMLGPTWPNRLYWMTGTIDPDGLHGGPITANAYPNGAYTWTTYAERLQAAGISWRVYQEQDNFGCNLLENFAQFQNAQPGNPLYDNGMARQAAGAFEDDARNDNLPRVSWIIPTSTQSEHPDCLPAAGADFVASKIEAIAANPEVWAKTVFILTYDENDGLFDHVPPPSPRAGTTDEFVGGLAIGAGFRVPTIIISPWTAGGWVCTESSTTPPRCGSSSGSPAWPNRTSATGGGAPSATSPPRSASARRTCASRACRTRPRCWPRPSSKSRTTRRRPCPARTRSRRSRNGAGSRRSDAAR
jgi:phospholipase C